ncbi:uncharacterized protein LOC119679340 [Teleopsis dalmanni]|uniref:uncharacterized protein LOC119679340 n=1 Tax=Teleopsis dalmanni TaxID=139649 RepID=UPI0018CFA952|nr:uncharacterized protein LOC119679340 [Teleopsis dalmanni]
MYRNALKSGARTALQAWKVKNDLAKLRFDLTRANAEFEQHLCKAVNELVSPIKKLRVTACCFANACTNNCLYCTLITTAADKPSQNLQRKSTTHFLHSFHNRQRILENGHLNTVLSSKQFVKVQKQFYREFSNISLGAPIKNSEAPLLGDLCDKYRAVIARTSANLNYQPKKEMTKQEFQRLPTCVIPSHYDLELKPNLEEFTFEGKTSVQIKIQFLEQNQALIVVVLL